jgi:hypothetical protein
MSGSHGGEYEHYNRLGQWYSTGGTRRHLRGYKVEEKLYLGVREQKRLNTTVLLYLGVREQERLTTTVLDQWYSTFFVRVPQI